MQIRGRYGHLKVREFSLLHHSEGEGEEEGEEELLQLAVAAAGEVEVEELALLQYLKYHSSEMVKKPFIVIKYNSIVDLF